jgi:membrane protein YdbS with pleckstrin-like domain
MKSHNTRNPPEIHHGRRETTGKGRRSQRKKQSFGWLLVVSKVPDGPGCGWYAVQLKTYIVFAALGIVVVVVVVVVVCIYQGDGRVIGG